MNEPTIHLYDTVDEEDDGEAGKTTDTELAGAHIGMFTANGTPKSRSLAESVRILGRLIPGENFNLPTADDDYKYFIGLNPTNRQLMLIEELRHSHSNPTGTFNDYTNSQYEGVRINDIPNFTPENHFYYNRIRRTFRARLQITHGTTDTYIWQDVTPDVLHSGHVVWLGHHNTEAQALHHVGTFNSNHHYYAYVDNQRKVKHLQNSTYSAGTTITYTYSWTPYDADIRERLHTLEENAPSHSVSTLPFIEITGNDTVTRTFSLSWLKSFLDAGDRNAAELILNCGATYNSGTAGTITVELQYDGTNTISTSESANGTSVTFDTLIRNISELDNEDDIAIKVTTSGFGSTRTLRIGDINLATITSVEDPQVTDAEIKAGSESSTRKTAPDQYRKIVLAHETYPWSHSASLDYNSTFGTEAEFNFQTIAGVDYLVFSSAADESLANWFTLWEAHDEFAIVDPDTKDEIFHAEIDGDYDETNRRFPVINLPDSLGLTEGESYLLECTRGAPDLGQTLPTIRRQVLEGIELFSHAKLVDSNTGEYVDLADGNEHPIPRDRRFANIPLNWKTEYLNALHFIDITDATTWADDTVLICSIKNDSGNLSLVADTTNGLSDISGLQAMQKHDVLIVEGTNGTDNGVVLAMFVATADWSDANGLAIDSVFYLATNDHFDYDNDELPVNIYMTGAPPALPEDMGGMQQGSNFDPTRSLVLQTDGEATWQDVLANPTFDEVYKAGTSETDYTENVSSEGVYSLKSGYDWRDYGEIIFGLGRSNWTRMFLIPLSRDLWDTFTREQHGFGGTSGDGRIDIGGYSNYLMTVRMVGNNQFRISASSGFNIRAIWGKRQGE